jgi:hypothetical protein
MIYTAYAQHFATGEGMTYMVLFTQGFGSEDTDTDHTEIRADFAEKFGDYYAIGVEIYEGLRFDLEGINFLVSEKMQAELERLKDAAHVEYHAQFHFNFT